MENSANTPQSVTNAFVRALNRQDVNGKCSRRTPNFWNSCNENAQDSIMGATSRN
jgi:hypothetical protein